jgi:uncharacterized protein YidB (DUF937 family)
MGLLDELLGQLAGGVSSGDAVAPGRRSPGAEVSGSEGSMGKVMMALLPVVLAMLARGQRERSAGLDQGPGAGGGLGDILGQVLGGSTGGSGGLGALLEQFQRAGFGDQARSWVNTGRNLPIPAEAIEQVFGRGGVTEIARRAGVSETDAARGLSQLMPEVVDRVTPGGEVPDASVLLASVESLAKRLGAA